MPTHSWGDPWFLKYGNQLYQAIEWCMSEWKRRARLGSHGKEKYGSFRHHPVFWTSEWPIHSLVKPGYVYYQWPRWVMSLELALGKILERTPIPHWIIRWQKRVYLQVLMEATCKWPEIKAELLEDTWLPEDV